jgi:flagellar basal-body rod modification protein FlgD
MEASASISELFPSRETPDARRAGGVEDMGSDDFLALMVAQLKNQDPTKPMDNMQFMGQLAQFGTVSGIQELNAGFSGLSSALASSQGLQAASLVGRSVVTDSNLGTLAPVGILEGEPVYALDATVEFAGASSGGTFYVQDLSGRLIYSSALPPSDGGSLKVRWDGLDALGEPMPPGTYRVSADASIGGAIRSLSVHAHQDVDSVAVDSSTGEVTLGLSNGRDVRLSDVKAFH